MSEEDMNTPIDTAKVSVLATATKLLVGAIATQRRKGVWIQPTADIRIGGASVNTTDSPILYAGMWLYLDWTMGDNWYGMRNGGSNVDVYILPVK